MSRRVTKKPMAQINIVPYIDVMLVLLVIFMITTPLLSQGVNVDLPQAAAKTLQDNKEPIIVSVDSRGLYYLNIASNPGAPLSSDALSQRVAAELKLSKKRQILVKGDDHVNYGKVVQAMVLLQHAGAGHVGLVTHALTK